MSVDVTKKFIPGHGTLFIAPPGTAIGATPLASFTLTGPGPTGWENLGHTSKDNLFAFSRDGGDKTVLDSYMADGISTVYDSVQWALGVNPIQIDKNALDLAFGGNFDVDGGYIVPASNVGLNKALVLLLTDGTANMLFYIPNTNVAIGDAPSLDAAKFLELPLSASILAAPTSDIPAAANGQPGIMKIYKASLVSAAPVISSALPSGAAAGQVITLVGTDFTNVTGVTVGGVTAAYDVISQTKVYVTLPAGSAGSAPIVVTSTVGASPAKAYTRT